MNIAESVATEVLPYSGVKRDRTEGNVLESLDQSAVSKLASEVTSQSLWSRYNRHFVGITRFNVLS